MKQAVQPTHLVIRRVLRPQDIQAQFEVHHLVREELDDRLESPDLGHDVEDAAGTPQCSHVARLGTRLPQHIHKSVHLCPSASFSSISLWCFAAMQRVQWMHIVLRRDTTAAPSLSPQQL